MKEIYWISTLSSIGVVSSVLAILLGITLCFLIPISIILLYNDDEYEYKKIKKLKNITIIPFVICLILGIFIPSKEDMYIIYGVGGTIDYIKNNDKAIELPDKIINACDAYLESIINDNNHN